MGRNYWSYFGVQFLGAFNDNVFKNALVILITYQSYTILNLAVEQVVALCGGIFILPFFLFSGLAGQMSDYYNKGKMIRVVKFCEILIMSLAAVGFCYANIELLLLSLFLMGVQSSFFGPIKYSLLPEIVPKPLLLKANAYVETSTFLAILLGTILGGVLIAQEQYSDYLVSLAILVLAIIGWIISLMFKPSELKVSAQPEAITFSVIKSSIKVMSILKESKSVLMSAVGISWFWFLGGALLSLVPIYVKGVLYGDAGVVTYFLALFSIGVACGSLVGEKLSNKGLELGFVPIATVLMSVFMLDIFIVGAPFQAFIEGQYFSLSSLKGNIAFLRVSFDFYMIALFGGIYILPLYTLIQLRSDAKTRSRVIAANNILNALFLVLSALLLTGLFAFKFTADQVFGVLVVINVFVNIYIFTIIPEFILRLCCVFITRFFYRFKVRGVKNIPSSGAAILASNHISFVDWLLIATVSRRPVRFVMHYGFYKMKFIHFIFRGAKIIPIAGAKENPKILKNAFKEIEKALLAGDLLCVFPEGKISADGNIIDFRSGIEKIINKTSVPIVPVTINGLWGSFFSRKYNSKACSNYKALLTGFRKPVEVVVGPSLRLEEVGLQGLQQAVEHNYKSSLET